VLALARALDQYAGRYRELRNAASFGEYLSTSGREADEEVLTEPVLASILEGVLGFGKGDYFSQRGRGGLKPDFTPTDPVTHPFVLDAKGSGESLSAHVAQIRRYVEQRQLRHGILFNLRQVRVYARGAATFERALSFELLPVWRASRGEQLPVGPDFEAFEAFCDTFSLRQLSTADKIAHIRAAEPWAERLGEAEVDVEFLVDQLRKLAAALAHDAGTQVEELVRFLETDADREGRLLDELRQLALDVQPGIDIAALPDAVAGWRNGTGTVDRVWRQYLMRVAYLSLTRILLYRAWEDVGFVDEMLFDGGFDTAYETLDESLRNVLRRAFLLGSDRYRTLFLAESTYDWFRPDEDLLADVLYRLGAIPLGKLDRDALGALYVSYVDEIDRDRLGQFFTPRDVVSFMLDRAGFAGPDVFRVEGDERRPRRVLDFATGSGGFLVEAARRVIDESGIAPDDPRGLQEALRAISTGFYGGEISPFPYYLTEINLLLQVSRLLGRMRVAGVDAPPFVLGVLRTDTLATRVHSDASLDVGAEHRADRAELVTHDIYDVLPVEPEKLGKYRDLRENESFDLVVGNPPYVAEPNNKPLFEHFRSIAAWRDLYRGKTDYLYYFLLLAIEKLRPGGRLCVITPAGWMNAGNADFLRERLARELTIDEIFLFGSYRLFAADQGPAPTPTVESAIVLATKAPAPSRHRVRIVALEGDRLAGPDGRSALLEEMAARAAGRAGRARGIHVHSVPQADLRPEHPWPVKQRSSDLPARVVKCLDAALTDETAPVVPLDANWKPFIGIQTCADAFTPKLQRNLPPDVRAEMGRRGAALGEPIYALPPGWEIQEPWASHPGTLVRSPEPEGVLYGLVDPSEYINLVRLTRTGPPSEVILDAVSRWKPVLESRAEIRRNPRRKWWETGWPRDDRDIAAPKVIALHRTDRGRFAVDETGEWSPSGRMCVVVGRDESSPVAYLCGLLNSELLDLWYGVRGRVPRDIWRDYEPKPLKAVPYRRPDGDPRADEVAERVREIAANRRALLPHRPVVRRLGATIKDPWRAGPVEIDRSALVGELPKRELVSVRIALEVHGSPAGRSSRSAPGTLAFRRGREETGRVEGEPTLLDLLESMLAGKAHDDPASLLLPKSLALLEDTAARRVSEVERLLDEGRRLVEEVERLVCALYDVPDDLAEAVVAHAHERAARAASAG
jgi:hypothetical protein